MTARTAPGTAHDSLHVPFIAVALAIAILGGFALAVILPARMALGVAGERWGAYAQVHGHLQAVGFVGLFIVGVGYRLVANFAGKPAVRYPSLVPLSLWLIVSGVLLRMVGQPSAAGHTAFAVLMSAGACLELLGAACFAVNIYATLRPFPRHDAAALFFTAGAAWFLVQALLGAWWVVVAAYDRSTLLSPAPNGLLVLLQFFGFHLMFILGVGVRSFPVFFAMTRPSARMVAVPFALTQVGLASATLAGMIAATSTMRVDWLQNAGMVALAVGVGWVAAYTGWWRPPTRIRPASRPFALTLQPALAWLTIACAIVLAGSLRSLARGSLPPWNELDAVRHIIAAGVVLTTIVAMAQLVLPEFASERFSGRQGAWRGIALGGLLTLATLLRIGGRFLAGAVPPDVINWAMASSGAIALSVMLVFAVLFARGVRHHRALRERFEALAAGGPSWMLTPGQRGPERSQGLLDGTE
jgi:hypothetical protein